MNTKIILLSALLSTGLAPATRADVDIGISADIRVGRALPPPPPDVVVVEQVGPPGPPPWAESHWYRRTHTYYYYPGSDVYFRPDTRMWFYLDSGGWRSGVRLPDAIRIDFGRAVALSLDNDHPYVYHQQVVRYYPSDYFAKVKFPGGHDNHRDDGDHNNHGNDHGDDHDNGHGKDKHH